MTWDRFGDQISEVPATVADPADPFLYGATPDDPVVVWKNHLLIQEDPIVQPVETSTRLAIPAASVLVVLSGFVALIIAFRAGGRPKTIAGVALAGALVAGFLHERTRQWTSDTSCRTPGEDVALETVFALLGSFAVALLETSEKDRMQQLQPLVT